MTGVKAAIEVIRYLGQRLNEAQENAKVLALDRAALTAQLFEGKQPVAHTSVSPLDWVYSDQDRQYPFDPQAAGKLLDAAAGTTARRTAPASGWVRSL